MFDGLDENNGTEQRSFFDFFWHPCKLGKDLLAIEKFGLVQYVSAENFIFFKDVFIVALKRL